MITASQLRAAANGTAWKTASMRGYLFKTVLDADTYGAGAYTLTFRKASNSGGNPQDYVFYFNVDPTASAAAAAATSATNLILDEELLGHVLNSSWQTSTQADCENARDGGGNW